MNVTLLLTKLTKAEPASREATIAILRRRPGILSLDVTLAERGLILAELERPLLDDPSPLLEVAGVERVSPLGGKSVDVA